MSLKKDKQKVLGEVFDDERIQSFLDNTGPSDVDADFYLLEKAYRGMNIDNFETFLGMFTKAGHNINASNPSGENLLHLVTQHKQGSEYSAALKTHGAV